jgi:hypothetical protein
VEHLKKTLKDLKSTWIVGHIKVLRILRDLKCMQFLTQEQKQWFETFETPLQKKIKINCHELLGISKL